MPAHTPEATPTAPIAPLIPYTPPHPHPTTPSPHQLLSYHPLPSPPLTIPLTNLYLRSPLPQIPHSGEGCSCFFTYFSTRSSPHGALPTREKFPRRGGGGNEPPTTTPFISLPLTTTPFIPLPLPLILLHPSPLRRAPGAAFSPQHGPLQPPPHSPTAPCPSSWLR